MKTISNLKDSYDFILEHTKIFVLVSTYEDYVKFNHELVEWTERVKEINRMAWKDDMDRGLMVKDFKNEKIQYLGVQYLMIRARIEDETIVFYFDSEDEPDIGRCIIYNPNSFFVDLL